MNGNRAHVAIASFVIAAGLLVGCSNPSVTDTKATAITTIVPQFAFTTASSSRSSRMAVPSTAAAKDAFFYFFSPILTGFSIDSTGIAEGGTLSATVMSDTLTVTVTKQSDGSILYSGVLSDSSGTQTGDLTLTVNSDRTFTYEQTLFINDPYGKLDEGTADSGLVKATLSGGTISSTGAFRADSTVSILIGGYARQQVTNGELFFDPSVGTGYACWQVAQVTDSSIPTSLSYADSSTYFPFPSSVAAAAGNFPCVFYQAASESAITCYQTYAGGSAFPAGSDPTTTTQVNAALPWTAWQTASKYK